MPDLHEPELLDAFFEALSDNLAAPAPRDLAPQDAEVARSIVALEGAIPEPGPEAAARIWTRVLASVPAANRQQPSTALAPPTTAPARVSWRLRRSRSWVAPAAAILLLALIGGTALSLGPQAQAQVRRLACLVPGLGVRACSDLGLVSLRAVSATGSGLSEQVLGLQASPERTLVRLRLGGLRVPTGIGAGLDQRFQDARPVVEQIQSLQIELRDARGEVVPPVAPDGRAWPGTAPGGARSARILSYWIELATDGTWRLSVTAEWAFGTLDPSVRSVDVVVPAPPGPLEVNVPLVPTPAASLPLLGSEGAEVVQHGLALQVAGVATTSAGLTLQVAARSDTQAEHVVSLGTYEPGEVGRIWGRVLWDDQGHQHIESGAGPADARFEGQTYLQTLTFAGPLANARPASLEVPSVFVLEDTPPASVTIVLDGRQVGERIPLETKLAVGRYPLQVHGATIEASSSGRELVVDLDLGDVNDGRALLGARTVQVAGRDDLGPRVSPAQDATGQYQRLHVPLPPDIGPQLTLTFSGALVEVRGPWWLPVPPGPGEQP